MSSALVLSWEETTDIISVIEYRVNCVHHFYVLKELALLKVKLNLRKLQLALRRLVDVKMSSVRAMAYMYQ